MPVEASVERRLYALRQSPPCTAPKSTNSSGCVPSCEGGFAAGSRRSCTMSATSKARIVSRGRARPSGAWETSRPHLPIPPETLLPPARKQVSVPKATSLALRTRTVRIAHRVERRRNAPAKRERAAARGEPWPARVDEQLVVEDPDAWVPTASVLHSNGDGYDRLSRPVAWWGVGARADDRVQRGGLVQKY